MLWHEVVTRSGGSVRVSKGAINNKCEYGKTRCVFNVLEENSTSVIH